MEHTSARISDFLKYEKKLLQQLAFDVADAETDHEMAKTKAVYSVQLARVAAIEETLTIIKEGLASK